MAAGTTCVEESENLLERTLSCLKSTSKGQLKYNGDVCLDENGSDQLVCTLESYFSHSPESIRLVNNSLNSGDEELTRYDPNLSQNSEVGSQRSAEPSPSGNDGRNNMYASTFIAENFESGNEFSIKEYHAETREIADTEKYLRGKIFERRTKNLMKHTAESVELWLNEYKMKNERLRSEMAKRERDDFEEMKRKKEQLDRKAIEHKQKLDEIIRKATIEESHFTKEEKKRKEVLENLKSDIASLYHRILQNVDIIQKKFKDFAYMSFIAGVSYKGVIEDLSQVITKTEMVFKNVNDVAELSVAENHLKVMVRLVERTVSIEKNVMIILQMAEESAIKKRTEMEEARLKQEERKRQAEEAIIEKNRRAVENVEQVDEKPPVSTLSSKAKQHEENMCISNEAFSHYMKLQQVLKETEDSFKDFAADPKQAKYKFDLHKAVNVPINSLSAQSPNHLKEQILRLVTILSGDNVTVGRKTVNCKSHPAAMAFCKNLVAKKLVLQGAQQVSSSPSSAFIYAAVIVGIWSAFPDVGELILAHFHQAYPYLVPYYLPMQDDQSNEDYHKALGYSITQGKVEDQDTFLKKFSGTVQLYAAVLSSSGADKPDHPHGVEQGWTWLARVLNLQPHPGVTATMLYNFISVSGHMLMKKYGKQFQKLLLVLCKEFVPSADKVTPPESRGPAQRLKDFLEECIRMKRIPVPEGYLTERWWHSGHF